MQEEIVTWEVKDTALKCKYCKDGKGQTYSLLARYIHTLRRVNAAEERFTRN